MSNTYSKLYKLRTESDEQQEVINFCNSMADYGIEEYKLIFHIANEGKRTKRNGARLKREGLKKGIPDLFLPVAKSGYNGLFIEMKKRGGRTSVEQKWWIEKLRKQGYLVEVCDSSTKAIDLIQKYIGSKINEDKKI